ncbi:MAG: hypothetical protein GY792_00130 [Gammaproteobacteria bacterium]|nr:hypothetical protein [Gammaproteobacteria bacterium]
MLYHVEVSEDSLKDYRTAFASATAKVIENETYETVIAVDDIKSLDTFVYPVIFGIANKLKKFGAVDIAYNKIFLETKERKSKFNSGVIIASYVADEYLSEILSDSRATDTIFVTNMTDKLQEYLSRNNSTEINDL